MLHPKTTSAHRSRRNLKSFNKKEQNRLKLLEKQITKLDEEHEDDSTYRIELQFLEQEKNQLQLFLKKWGPQEVFEG